MSFGNLCYERVCHEGVWNEGGGEGGHLYNRLSISEAPPTPTAYPARLTPTNTGRGGRGYIEIVH